MESKDTYKTILVIVTGLLVFSKILTITVLVPIALLVGVISIFIPPAARAIEWAWLKLAFALGWVNSRILLSLVYFVFLLPIAWVSRKFTKDPLKIKGQLLPDSLFTTRNHVYKKEDLENIW